MISKIIRFRTFLLNYFLKELPLAFFLSFFLFIKEKNCTHLCMYICISISVYSYGRYIYYSCVWSFSFSPLSFFFFLRSLCLLEIISSWQRVTVVRQTNFEADFVCCVLCYNRATYACKYVIILVSWHPSACTGLYIRTLRRVQAPDRSRLLPEAPAACSTLCYAVSFYPWSSSASWPKKGQDHKERAQRSKHRLQCQCQCDQSENDTRIG